MFMFVFCSFVRQKNQPFISFIIQSVQSAKNTQKMQINKEEKLDSDKLCWEKMNMNQS